MLSTIDEIDQDLKKQIPKIIIAPLVFLLSLLVPAVKKFLIDHILLLLSQRTLWILMLIFGYLCVLSILYAYFLRKKIKEITALKLKFNVYWDKDKNAYCPSCKKPLGGYTPRPPAEYFFWCHSHGADVYLHDDATPISLEDARKQL